jgi:protein involved in polysaccharide export with SLBB domain
MRVWAEIYSAAGARTGDGSIANVLSFSITRKLDEVGSIAFTLLATDPASAQIVIERRAYLYTERNNDAVLLGICIIRKIEFTQTTTNATLSVDGPDILDELKRINTGFARTYNNQTLATIIPDLLTLVSGWSSTITATKTTSARWDAVSVMGALQNLAAWHGYHLRLATSGKTVEFGTFGTAASLIVLNTGQISSDLLENDAVALIDTIALTTVSEDIYTRIFPLGAGQNVDAAITLASSTRTTPYTIQSLTRNSRTHYYLEDSAAVALYGVIERVRAYRDITPLSTSATDIELCANTIYDNAAVDLARACQTQDTYRITLKKVNYDLNVGDKIRVIFKGLVQASTGAFQYRDIDAELWVMGIRHSASSNNHSYQIDVATIDLPQETSARAILGSIEQAKKSVTNIQPALTHYNVGPEQLLVNASTPATAGLIISNAVLDLQRVLLRVRTRPFTSTVTTSAAGGDHRHKVASYDSGASASTERAFQVAADATGFSSYVIQIKGPAFDWWTKDASGSHTHAMTYGIYADTTRPVLSITVNGTSVGTGLGTTGANLDTTIDITTAVKNKVGGFRDTIHNVVVTPSTGQGEVLLNFDVYEYISPQLL